MLAASGSKSSGDSQLALVFDHGDSSGHTKQELSLRIIDVAGGDTQYQGVHNAMQTEVSDGARAIWDRCRHPQLKPILEEAHQPRQSVNLAMEQSSS